MNQRRNKIKRSRKKSLINELAAVMVNNWIVAGDKLESMRANEERKVRNIYATSTIAELESHLANITRR